MSDSERQLYLALAAIAAAVLALIWLIGALAGLIFGGGWTSIGASELAMTAVKLPSHLGDPRAAWPREARAALPGAPGFYASAALVLAALCGVVLLCRRYLELDELLALGGGRRRAPSARWASRRDLAPLRVPSPQRKRLTLGWSGRALLAAQERQSVIAFAPTESHKTTGLAIPALLEWQGPVLATSIKSDLLIDTVAHRQTLGEVMVFDPALVTGLEPSRATPLWGARSWRGAMRVAHWLAAAARTGSGGLQDADFWYSAAEKLLAPLLFAAAASGRTMESVVRWLDEGPDANDAHIEELLNETGEAAAKRAWQATQNREERQRSSVYTTAEMIVGAFADPRVAEETKGADYSPAALLDGGANTLYLCAPLHEQERLRTVFSMLVQELLAVVYETVAATGQAARPAAAALAGRVRQHRADSEPGGDRLDRRRAGRAAAERLSGHGPGQLTLRATGLHHRQQSPRQGLRHRDLGPRDPLLRLAGAGRRGVRAALAQHRREGPPLADRGRYLPRPGSGQSGARARPRHRAPRLRTSATGEDQAASLVRGRGAAKAARGVGRQLWREGGGAMKVNARR